MAFQIAPELANCACLEEVVAVIDAARCEDKLNLIANHALAHAIDWSGDEAEVYADHISDALGDLEGEGVKFNVIQAGIITIQIAKTHGINIVEE